MNINIDQFLSFDMLRDVRVLPRRDLCSIAGKFRSVCGSFSEQIRPNGRSETYPIDVAFVGFKPRIGGRPSIEEAIVELVLFLPKFRFVRPAEFMSLYNALEHGYITQSEECRKKTWRDMSLAIPGYMLSEARDASWNYERPAIYAIEDMMRETVGGSMKFALTPCKTQQRIFRPVSDNQYLRNGEFTP